MKEAKVDVVIPVYNAGRWIETTLDSLLDQGDVLNKSRGWESTVLRRNVFEN